MLIDQLERSSVILLAVLLSGCYCDVDAHFEYPQENHSAKHRILKAKQSIEKVDSSDPWQLLQMALSPAYAATSNVSIVLDGNYRVIKSNGLPDQVHFLTQVIQIRSASSTIPSESLSLRRIQAPSLHLE